MKPKKIVMGKRPERIIQDDLIMYLRARSWFVRETHGNAYQNGFPDLFTSHVRYGARWIECKVAEKYSFTAAQLEVFPQFVAAGSGIWILTAASDTEYAKLFKSCNWWQYLSVMK